MAVTNPFDKTMTIQPVPAGAPDGGAATPTINQGTGTSASAGAIAPSGTAAVTQAPSTGILSSAMNNAVTAPTTADKTTNATATKYDASQATNSAWDITPDQTVAGQTNKIISEGSPLLDKARADAAQTANGRGLLNSSMAAGAGTAALFDKALQIATPDAQTNAAAGAANAASKNQTSQFNTSATNTAAATNANAENTTSLANAQAKNAATSQDAAASQQAQSTNLAAGIQTATTAYQGALQTALANASEADKMTLSNIDAQVRQNLAQIQAQYQTQMQTSQSSSQMYSQTMNTIGQIMQDKDLDSVGKQNLIDQAMNTFKNGLNIQMAITNIPGVASLISNLTDAGAKVGTGANGNTDGMTEAERIAKLNRDQYADYLASHPGGAMTTGGGFNQFGSVQLGGQN